jgi:hypothetical protein
VCVCVCVCVWCVCVVCVRVRVCARACVSQQSNAAVAIVIDGHDNCER